MGYNSGFKGLIPTPETAWPLGQAGGKYIAYLITSLQGVIHLRGCRHGVPKTVIYFISMAREPPAGQGLLNIEASRSHTVRHIWLSRTPLDKRSARRI